MIIDEITRDDVITVLEHVQATCMCREDCLGCQYNIFGLGCAFAYLPERWELDQIRKEGDQND